MKRWSATLLLVVLILWAILPVTALMAEPAEKQLEEDVKALRRQILELKKQIIDKLVAANQLTAEEGEKYKQKLEQRFERQLDKLLKEGKGQIKKLKPKLKPGLDTSAD